MRVFCAESLASNSNYLQNKRNLLQTRLHFGQANPDAVQDALALGTPLSSSVGADVVVFPNARQKYLFDEFINMDPASNKIERDKLWGILKAQQGHFGRRFDHTAVIS